MAWENLQERLKYVFRVKISFPNGSVWLPDTQLNIDEWLMSLAETDEELKELNIRRIRFLQNRWPIEKLLELRWDDSSDRRVILVMNVGRRAYIFFSDGYEYQLIAAIEPRTEAALYRAVIGKLLQNSDFVRSWPTRIINYRPDLLPDIETEPVLPAIEGPQSHQARSGGGYLSELLVGWVGKWIDLPVLGYWHHEGPHSITTLEKGKYVMKYKPTYGDKQREEQRRRKEEELPNRQIQPESAKEEVSDKSKHPENPPERHDDRVA
jgi:hypothetical protein